MYFLTHKQSMCNLHLNKSIIWLILALFKQTLFTAKLQYVEYLLALAQRNWCWMLPFVMQWRKEALTIVSISCKDKSNLALGAITMHIYMTIVLLLNFLFKAFIRFITLERGH